jgi:TIR domain
VKRKIFLSYRRDDTEGEARLLFNDLAKTYGPASVFMDVEGIEKGIDYRRVIDHHLKNCGALLAIIGPAWLTILGSSGQRRLDEAEDPVRHEIATALARKDIAVIPVLVHGGKMPRLDQLPDNLKDLAHRNCVEITHPRWNSDVQLLTKALRSRIAPAKNVKSGLIRLIRLAATIVVIGLVLFLLLHSGSHHR